MLADLCHGSQVTTMRTFRPRRKVESHPATEAALLLNGGGRERFIHSAEDAAGNAQGRARIVGCSYVERASGFHGQTSIGHCRREEMRDGMHCEVGSVENKSDGNGGEEEQRKERRGEESAGI